MPKAAKWVKGRQHIWQTITQKMAALPPTKNRLWVHCASLGEFEQGRPIIEALKQQNPDIQVILTFFSPSGYEVRKNYAQADAVFYLPPDTPKNAERWLQVVQPTMAVFVKYEFWLFYLRALHHYKVPVALVSAIFRQNQHFFKWYGKHFRRLLAYYNIIFVQDQNSEQLLHKIGITHTQLAPDTRFDRVLATAAQPITIPIAKQFTKGRKTIICGSTWDKDIQLLATLIRRSPPDLCFIIAPHEITPSYIAQLQTRLGSTSVILFSQVVVQPHILNSPTPPQTLIIDNIGMLAQLYRYGNYAYIGGGFGAGIHNILEAAVFGLPLFFGPNYHKFREAVQLTNLGGAITVKNAQELKDALLQLHTNTQLYTQASETCSGYVRQNSGGTPIIMNWLSAFIFTR